MLVLILATYFAIFGPLLNIAALAAINHRLRENFQEPLGKGRKGFYATFRELLQSPVKPVRTWASMLLVNSIVWGIVACCLFVRFKALSNLVLTKWPQI